MVSVVQFRIARRTSSLEALKAAISEQDARIERVTTVRWNERETARRLTIRTRDEAHTVQVLAATQRVPGVEIEAVTDPVFAAHEGGKITQASRVPLRSIADLRQIYTPGVARVATAIRDEPAGAWHMTGIGNSVGIFTNGSRVLGLGDVGVLAGMPVMEGKAVLYSELAGVSATPILVDTRDPSVFVETVLRIAPTFGGIHLEDIRSPDCFRIEQELSRRLAKPVLHDDQHGTATVVLAAVINACRSAAVSLRDARVAQLGLGAAGSAIAKLLVRYGVGEMLVTDTSSSAMDRMREWRMRPVSLKAAFEQADIVIATTGKGHWVDPQLVRAGQVVLALSNPDPEIAPEAAMRAGAAFAADGRSVNNALAFPGLFKGALAAKSRSIVPEMLIAAAETIARRAPEGDLVPNVLDRSVHADVARSVARCAVELGLGETLRMEAEEATGSTHPTAIASTR